MNRSVVHIGFPKTGTTSLQKLLFARHPEINYLGQSIIWKSEDTKALLYSLLTETDMQKKARGVLEKLQQLPGKVVISDEALSCGEFMQRAVSWGLKTDHAVIANRIHSIMGEVEIIIVIRRQDDWLESWYRQGLKTGKYISESFSNWLENELSVTGRRHLYALLNYDELYGYYANIFGQDHVHLFLYEDYQQCFHLLARDIATRIGVNADKAEQLMLGNALNVTGHEYTSAPLFLKRLARTSIVRRFWTYAPKLVNRLRLLVSTKHDYPAVTAHEKTSVMEQFYNSNSMLFQHLGRSTNYHGYVPE